ncbi:hypothetical protein SDC9_206819 [bioreactor metagenome]|uniref:Uncharacterized protein n=1 Tax=bioreactor metagenome TaxID=1076179 RepID=A0A645J656_9ZZZZ
MFFSQVLNDNYERFNVHITRLKVVSEGINQHFSSNIEANNNVDFFPFVQINDISDNLKEITNKLDVKNKSMELGNIHYVVNYIIKVFEMIDDMIEYINSSNFSSLITRNNELRHLLAQYELKD